MIKVDKNFDALPASLSPEKAEHWVRLAIQERNSHVPRAHIYASKSVVDFLRTVYFDKCCYCEGTLGAQSAFVVDHFRPHGPVSGVDGRRGYFWLAYEWSNLLCSCEQCNKKKGSRFPLADERMRLCEPDEIQANWRADGQVLLAENALLIHPEIQDPEDHLDVGPDGTLNAKSLSGETTRDICDLNRDGLVRERKKLIERFRASFKRIGDSIVYEAEKGVIDKDSFKECVKSRFYPEFSRLERRGNPDRKYSLVGKCMVRQFDFFFTSRLAEGDHKRIIAGAYVFYRAEKMRGGPNA